MRALLPDIWEGVRSQPGRTGLSFLAVSVGMIALTVLLAALGGLRDRSRQILREFGGQVFVVVPQAGRSVASARPLTEAQARRLAAGLPGSVVSTTRRFEHSLPGNAPSVAVIATDQRLAEVRQWRLLRGRFLDERDLRHRERSVVVSEPLARLPGWDLGQTVRLMDLPFTIVGVLPAEGEALASEAGETAASYGQRAAYVPRGLAGLWLERRTPEPAEVGAVLVRVPPEAELAQTVATAQRILSDRGTTAADYDWITPERVLKGVRRMQATIGYTVGSVAGLCLILGGTTLMSLMLANVRDRVTEIGLRRALGAHPADVATLFLVEGCLVTGGAALLGTAATHLVLWLGAARLPLPLRLDGLTFFLPLAVAVVLAAVFSYGPARLAAGITPSEALRSE